MLKRLVISLLLVPALASVLLIATGHKYFLTALSRTYLVGESTANINDHERFDTRVIKAGPTTRWPEHARFGDLALPQALLDTLRQHDAAAFVIAHRGELLAEHYFDDYSASSRTNSFSVAKTVVSLLLGIAIDEGIVGGLDQPLVSLLPEFADDPNAQAATLGSLSTMTSGYDWDERYYSPFSPTVELLYTDDVTRFVLEREFTEVPETYYYYSSASTELLAIALTRALRERDPAATLSGYLSEKLWQPLGMNDDGLWHLDGSGMELAYCCINTNARNFAKVGQLMLERGQWQGRALVPADFVTLMTTPAAKAAYGYSTHLSTGASPPFFAMRGHLGQYVVVVPEHELVIVRLGEQRNTNADTMNTVLPFYIEQALKVVAAAGAES